MRQTAVLVSGARPALAALCHGAPGRCHAVDQGPLDDIIVQISPKKSGSWNMTLGFHPVTSKHRALHLQVLAMNLTNGHNKTLHTISLESFRKPLQEDSWCRVDELVPKTVRIECEIRGYSPGGAQFQLFHKDITNGNRSEDLTPQLEIIEEKKSNNGLYFNANLEATVNDVTPGLHQYTVVVTQHLRRAFDNFVNHIDTKIDSETIRIQKSDHTLSLATQNDPIDMCDNTTHINIQVNCTAVGFKKTAVLSLHVGDSEEIVKDSTKPVISYIDSLDKDREDLMQHDYNLRLNISRSNVSDKIICQAKEEGPMNNDDLIMIREETRLQTRYPPADQPYFMIEQSDIRGDKVEVDIETNEMLRLSCSCRGGQPKVHRMQLSCSPRSFEPSSPHSFISRRSNSKGDWVDIDLDDHMGHVQGFDCECKYHHVTDSKCKASSRSKRSLRVEFRNVNRTASRDSKKSLKFTNNFEIDDQSGSSNRMSNAVVISITVVTLAACFIGVFAACKCVKRWAKSGRQSPATQYSTAYEEVGA